MRTLLTSFILFIAPLCKAEKLPLFIKRLAQAKGNVIVFNNYQRPIFAIPDLPETFKLQYQVLLKTPKGLFLTITGTGRLYQLEIRKDTLSLVRIDNTYFTGYNFNCLNFALDTTIYSYGGQGFWHENGDLRIYTPIAREWNIIRTDEYIPRVFNHEKSNNFYFIDTSTKSLFVSGPVNGHDPIKKNATEISPLYNKLFKLDIETGNWVEMGFMPDRGKELYMAITPYGLITSDLQIINISENKIYKVSDDISKKVINIPGSSMERQFRISFCIDSTIYFSNIFDWIDSITITSKDIIDTGKKVYTPATNSSSQKSYYILGVAIILLAGLFLARTYRRKNTPSLPIPNTTEQPEFLPNILPDIKFESSLPQNLLDVREKELLSFILNQSQNGKLSSIAQINEVLGLTKRNIDVQKNIRTDVIGSINEKCKYLTQNQENILQRVRSEMDKRMFEYFVPQDRFADAEKLLT